VADGAVTRDYPDDGGTLLPEYVTIEHPSLQRTGIYAHMATESVDIGEQVRAGQQIASSGIDPVGSYAHLHIGFTEIGRQFADIKQRPPDPANNPNNFLKKPANVPDPKGCFK
jgi:murein DD-endopeptidase MepM/ murein hydrolase activator NlpD